MIFARRLRHKSGTKYFYGKPGNGLEAEVGGGEAGIYQNQSADKQDSKAQPQESYRQVILAHWRLKFTACNFGREGAETADPLFLPAGAKKSVSPTKWTNRKPSLYIKY
jgi:hypothetical protein